ncbi:MAG: hypothetical protein WCG05_05475 [Alphaproteobacteria bacterium]
MTILLAQSNFRDSKQNAAWMAKKLIELGTTPKTGSEQMGQLYKIFLENELKEYCLEHNKTFEGQADMYAELIRGDLGSPDSHLKPALGAEFAKIKAARERKQPTTSRPRKSVERPERTLQPVGEELINLLEENPEDGLAEDPEEIWLRITKQSTRN